MPRTAVVTGDARRVMAAHHETRIVSKFLRDRPDDSWTFDAARQHNKAYGTAREGVRHGARRRSSRR